MAASETATLASAIAPVTEFLHCRTPEAWTASALDDVDGLLHDHACLELKAAQQAQTLIRKYAAIFDRRSREACAGFAGELIKRMSRLAREELRHFEQVVALIERRGGRFRPVPPARYAGALHVLASASGSARLVDSLIIGAVIEARSCERFFCLTEHRELLDEAIWRFYVALVRAEARHFETYLWLARRAAGKDIAARIEQFLSEDARLVNSKDQELKFLSGVLSA